MASAFASPRRPWCDRFVVGLCIRTILVLGQSLADVRQSLPRVVRIVSELRIRAVPALGQSLADVRQSLPCVVRSFAELCIWSVPALGQSLADAQQSLLRVVLCLNVLSTFEHLGSPCPRPVPGRRATVPVVCGANLH